MAPLPDAPSQLFLSVGALVGQEVHLDELLQTIVDRTAASMQADRGTLYLVDASRGELFSRAGHLPELKRIRLKLGQGVAGQVALAGVAMRVPDSLKEQHFFPDIDRLTGYRTKSLLAVPLKDGQGEVFGVLQVLNGRSGDHFTVEDETRLGRIAAEVSRILERTSLHWELRRAREQPQAPVGYFFNHVVGESPAMKAIYKVIQKAAPTQATVLIRGESGSGKELLARAVHANSPRRDKPWVKVDCASLPPTLIENELFGHEKGAFTGADQRQAGKFETADSGTIFLDEIGELPLEVQGKLLRVLQDREFERIGGTRTVKVDVRIVAATHRDLAAGVRDGTFREDLYYRIRVVEVAVPPLRERGAEDIERLARHFLALAAQKNRLEPVPRLTPTALERLKKYRWPGNVRELEHCMESAAVLCEGEVLPEHLALPGAEVAASPARGAGAMATLAEAERRHIAGVMETLGGNRTAAAKTLGIGRNTLARKLKAYGLE